MKIVREVLGIKLNIECPEGFEVDVKPVRCELRIRDERGEVVGAFQFKQADDSSMKGKALLGVSLPVEGSYTSVDQKILEQEEEFWVSEHSSISVNSFGRIIISEPAEREEELRLYWRKVKVILPHGGSIGLEERKDEGYTILRYGSYRGGPVYYLAVFKAAWFWSKLRIGTSSPVYKIFVQGRRLEHEEFADVPLGAKVKIIHEPRRSLPRIAVLPAG